MMSKFARISLALVLGLSFAAMAQTTPAAGTQAAAPAPNAPSATPAAPAPATGTKVGTINIEQAISASNEGRRDFDQLSKKFEPKQTELKNDSDEIESLKKQLNTTGDKLNEDTRANLVKQIESKQKLFDRKRQDATEEFQAQQGEIAQRILQKMVPVIQKYVTENGFGLLIDTSQPWPQGPVIMAGPAMDITEPVVLAYNQVSGVPAPAAAAGTKPAGGLKPGAPAATKPATTPTTKTPPSNPPKQ